MSIDEVCKASTQPKNQSFFKRHPKEVLEKYVSDLERVVALIKEGHHEPGGTALKRHFRESLNITVSRDTLNRHLQTLKEGGSLWPAK